MTPVTPEGPMGGVVEIQITYQTRDDADPVSLSLSPEDYFDPLEPGETYEADAIPRYNHPWRYLDVPPGRLKWTLERRSGTADDASIRTQYLDGGRSWMTHRSDPDGSEEIIHSTQIDDARCHILRTHRTGGGEWTVSYNGIIEDQADGSQAEVRFDRP